ncbi:MAG: heat-inducible transcriptional repressor HrcA [Acidimicrobiia bacterium]|nr:heat-inducible transcriptional repressor HrcA [Acidimicrobiia bacterium]
MLDDRKAHVLQALVEEYIRTGEPVSSQMILERSALDVSSATIRNEVARLESYGFVAQPHTSSGRIPTHQGYRYYVDHCSPARLRSATHDRIRSFFADVHSEVSRLLKETSGLVADITHLPAVVIGPQSDVDRIHAVHLVRLGASAVLVVTIAETGQVAQHVVTLGFEPTDEQVDEAERVLERVYAGRELDEANDDQRLKSGDLPDLVRRIIDPVHHEIQRVEGASPQLFIGGTSQLAGLWADLAIVHHMLDLLDRDSDLQAILGESTGGTSVRIGEEIGDTLDLAVVSTSFGPRGSGRVGVIGPMRMDYRRAIRVVEEISENLEESLGTE